MSVTLWADICCPVPASTLSQVPEVLAYAPDQPRNNLLEVHPIHNQTCPRPEGWTRSEPISVVLDDLQQLLDSHLRTPWREGVCQPE